MTDSIVKRTTLIVADAARSIAFYRDVVGMEEYYNQTMTVGGKIIPTGQPGATVHLGIMEASHPEVGKLGLLQWTDPPLVRAQPSTGNVGIGNLLLVLETDDMDGLFRRLQTSPDCQIHCAPYEWQVPRGDGTGSRTLFTLSFFDPDGFFVEVNHKPAEAQPDGLVIRRTTLVVTDVTRALEFYRDTLGLVVVMDQEMVIDAKVLPAGEPNARARVVFLRGEAPDTGMIGLLGFLEPPLTAPAQRRRELGIGDGLLVASTNNQPLEALYDRIQTSQGQIHAPPDADEVTAADGSIIKLTTLSLFDPDGFFMELNERRVILAE
jgi:catechol 2,3-dioxygenase-like lactoylglutathione lyase family enzyme